MAERQRSVMAAAGRPVDSLRALTQGGAMLVLSRLAEVPARPEESSSLGSRGKRTPGLTGCSQCVLDSLFAIQTVLTAMSMNDMVR